MSEPEPSAAGLRTVGLTVRYGGLVAKLNADGTPAWSFAPAGPQASVQTVAARGGSFAVGGMSQTSGDFDPGPATNVVSGQAIYLSRFKF